MSVSKKAFDAINGRLCFVDGMDELRGILDCLSLVIEFSPDEVLKKVCDFRKEDRIHSLVVNTLVETGDICISFVLDSDEYPAEEELDSQEGVLAYTFNASCEMYSEGGYIFFEKQADGFYHRIG